MVPPRKRTPSVVFKRWCARNSTRSVILQRRVAPVKYAFRCVLRLVMRVLNVFFSFFAGLRAPLFLAMKRSAASRSCFSSRFRAPIKLFKDFLFCGGCFRVRLLRESAAKRLRSPRFRKLIIPSWPACRAATFALLRSSIGRLLGRTPKSVETLSETLSHLQRLSKNY